MIRLPPRSTLFPYTARFQSKDLLGEGGPDQVQQAAHARVAVAEPEPGRRDREAGVVAADPQVAADGQIGAAADARSEEHTSELQSRQYLVCRLLLEKKKTHT